ncbi:P-loop containing nucleoside triphosphate hydrolases superfamily protein isoform 2 [Hibiscus syriacus]|uniref:gluconokinase n=1 Tax=Hibiscus syriacus TaxID=106335 RepID=A0A6A2XEK3_HIBSY|nr:P-loop containing nucleoside triphosphate hydrolases superfamily protein isoform 2 [Hibiscus syriacus]
MAIDHKGRAVVIMGVSGAGKSTKGDMLAKVLNCSFLDADDFHPLLNKEKMRQGISLSNEDRIPWLEMLRDGQFVLLDAEADVLAARLEKRAAEGKHFMPAALLQSQLELLNIDEGEEIFKVDATLSPLVIVSKIQAFLFSDSDQTIDKRPLGIRNFKEV